ncbi:MAG: (Fe-S)-binding protein [Thermoanaerobaculales bacterium]|jgi:Fe-S oxidoreductase|nr:(Fe-S)-binding protein [Thermoanaerobaculales bacterium]
MTSGRFTGLSDHFERVRRSLEEDCTACGLCLEDCPIFDTGVLAGADPTETVEGRIETASGAGFYEQAYLLARACIRCGACRDACPVEIDPVQANHLVRLAAAAGDGEAAARYAADTVGLRAMLPDNPTNPFRMLQVLQMREADVVWHTEIPRDPEQVDVLLFLSCVGMARLDRIRTLMDLLELTGVRFATIGGLDFCCGFLDALAGDLETGQRHFDRLAAAVDAFGAAELVTDCPSCYGWFADLGTTQQLPFAFRHTTQLLAEHLDELPPRRALEGCVTVHDPCHFGREPAEWEPSRRLVEAVPGLRLVEMERNREHTACCGGPATGYQPELGRRLTEARVREAERAGAETILSPCSGCISSLGPAARGAGMAAEDVVAPLARALGIEHENRLAGILAGETVDEILRRAAGGLWETSHDRGEIEGFVASMIARRNTF